MVIWVCGFSSRLFVLWQMMRICIVIWKFGIQVDFFLVNLGLEDGRISVVLTFRRMGWKA